jgi:hypothetical protein
MNPATRSALLEETFRRLVAIENCSELPTDEWSRGLLNLSSNDAVLRAAASRNKLTAEKPDVAKTDKPIE